MTPPADLARRVQELVEAIAAWDHKAWANWTRHLLDNLTPENMIRWRRQIDTHYADLLPHEQELDLKEAREVMALPEMGALLAYIQQLEERVTANDVLTRDAESQLHAVRASHAAAVQAAFEEGWACGGAAEFEPLCGTMSDQWLRSASRARLEPPPT